MHPHTHLPTQEEDEEKDVMDALLCLNLREDFQMAACELGKEEALAIVEQELQKHKRMN